jgi:uncharacterized protein (DUF1684 family)
MKYLSVVYTSILALSLLFGSCKPATSGEQSAVPAYNQAMFIARAAKDEDMTKSGIIEPAKQADFKGLAYFDPDSSYRIQSKIEWINKEKVVFATNTERAPEYYIFCRLHFIIADSMFSLTAYSTDIDGHSGLFIPFKDLTNTYSTYGGGRYLEVPFTGEKDSFTLDFNLAFNPYCHYNHSYSCPIVPLGNVLNIPIPAGEKKLYE